MNFGAGSPETIWRAVATTLVACAVVPVAGFSQEYRWEISVQAPATSLQMLRSEHLESVRGASTVISAAFFRNYPAYTDGQRRELLVGLERIAMGWDDSADEGAQRGSALAAIGILASLGRAREQPAAPESKEVPGLLLRVARASDVRSARTRAVMVMGQLLDSHLASTEEIERTLIGLAEGSMRLAWIAPGLAIQALQDGGTRGSELLRMLHERGRVTNGPAREELNRLAKQGFPTRSPWGPRSIRKEGSIEWTAGR